MDTANIAHFPAMLFTESDALLERKIIPAGIWG